jgi:biopolymer transport protein TolQ
MSEGLYSSNLMISSFISDADIVVKTTIFVLFLASFVTWAIVFDKIIKFRLLNFKAKKFEEDFWSGKEIARLYEKAKVKDNHPLSNVFVVAINEWHLQSDVGLNDEYAKERLKERIYQSMMVAKNRAFLKIKKNISFLASVASVSPFIGLFGTVWGIMNSFNAIVGAQNTNLAIIAPGISEALFATAVGLFSAIPALIFYNLFTNKLNIYVGRVEDFCIEIINLISRDLDKKKK